MHRMSLIFFLTAACTLFCSSSLFSFVQEEAEEKEEKKYKKDPYTENVEEVWRKAGYEAMGNFRWADGHGTQNIEDAIGGENFIFVETKHFKIGCSLPSYKISREDKIEKKKIESELKELRDFLPNIPKRIKTLDRWLRLHLYAMRAEKVYRQIQDLLQVKDDDFPNGPGQLKNNKYMGEGPFLGMTNKFAILLVEQESALGRYRSAFMKQSGILPIRHLFPKDGVMLFAVAQQNDGMSSDTSMHCLFVYALSKNILDGYKYYRHSISTWLPLGVSHYLARKVDMKRNYFTDKRLYDSNDKNIWNWEVKTRKRIDHEYFPSYMEMTEWGESTTLKYSDHTMAWARADFLLEKHPDLVASWFAQMQEPFPDGIAPTVEQIKERDHRISKELFEFKDSGGFDAAFANYVKKNYSKK